eukprot:COSAG05_NODE_2691_length_2766_cov_3.328084_3_plen_354_part_00
MVDVMVSFAEEGSLGLDLSEKTVHAEKWVWVKSIPPESQASKHPELKVGLRVVEVAGQAVLGKSLDSVFDLIISHPERPLTFGFALASDSAPVPDSGPAPDSAPDPAFGPAPEPAPDLCPGPAPEPAPEPASEPEPEPECEGNGVVPVEEGIPPELDVRARLQKIYTEHCPRKVQDIDKLLEEHAGKEEELLAKVEAKYLAPALAKRAWLKDPDIKRQHAKARESPRWVPDAESDRCMLCAAEFFGAGLGSRMAGALGLSAANTTSRHHCRYCGWVVCGTCSPEKVAHPSKPGVIGPQVLAVDRWVSSTDGHPIRILEGDVKEKRVCISCLEHAPTEVAERRRTWLSHRRGRE